MDKIEEDLESIFKIKYEQDLIKPLNDVYARLVDGLTVDDLRTIGEVDKFLDDLEKRLMNHTLSYEEYSKALDGIAGKGGLTYFGLTCPRFEYGDNIHRKHNGYVWFAELEYMVFEKIPYMDEFLNRRVKIRILFPFSRNKAEDGSLIPDRPIEMYSDKPLTDITILHSLIKELVYSMENYAFKSKEHLKKVLEDS